LWVPIVGNNLRNGKNKKGVRGEISYRGRTAISPVPHPLKRRYATGKGG